MQKTTKQNIVFVADLHGNERMLVRVLAENNIRFVLGNSKAYEKNIRFLERDINVSFRLDGKEYECIRAGEILNEISEDSFVVDFHSTMSEAKPFIIIVDEAMIPFAKRTGIERVVLMRHNIKKGNALINRRRGVSVETGRHESPESYQITLNVVQNVLSEAVCAAVLYEVYDDIREPGNYENFKEHKNGFIPILANEPEYESQGLFGLKARVL